MARALTIESGATTLYGPTTHDYGEQTGVPSEIFYMRGTGRRLYLIRSFSTTDNPKSIS